MKKIMFSDTYKLTEAVLSGRKTQTRRIIPNNVLCPCDLAGILPLVEDSNSDWHSLIKASRYKVGEVVAVAQSYKDAGVDYIPEEDEEFGYHDFPAEQTQGWNNKLYVRSSLMPHRIRITNVRVERLQDISDEDCIAEGIGISATDNRIGYPFSIPFNYYVGEDKESCRYSTPRAAYAALIDRISGRGTFDSNPYVFVYDFELVK